MLAYTRSRQPGLKIQLNHKSMNLPIPFAIYTLRPDYTAIIELEFSDEEGTLTMPIFGLMHDAKHIEGLKVETVFGN